MAPPIKPITRIMSINGPARCTCNVQSYIPLTDWVILPESKKQPEKVRNLTLRLLKLARLVAIPIDEPTIRVCPHRNLLAVSTNPPCALQTPEDRMQVWLNNVPLACNLLKRYNVHISHSKSLSTPDDELYYEGPLRSFNEMDFECLKTPASVMDLLSKKDKAIETIISEIRLL